MTKETVEATPPRFVPHNLSGKETGPKRDMVLMNAGAALEKLRLLREAAGR